MDPLVAKYTEYFQPIFERYSDNASEMETYEYLYLVLTNRRAGVKDTIDSLNAVYMTHKTFFIFMKVLQGPLDIASHDVTTIYDVVIELVLRILKQFKTRQDFLAYTEQRSAAGPDGPSPPRYSPPAYTDQWHKRLQVVPGYDSGVYDILAWYVQNFGSRSEPAAIGIQTFYKDIDSDDIGADNAGFVELFEILQDDFYNDTLAYIDTSPRFTTPWFLLMKGVGNMAEHARFAIHMKQLVFDYLFTDEPFPDVDGVFYSYMVENVGLADVEGFWSTVPDTGYDAVNNAVSAFYNLVDRHTKMLEM